MVKKNAKNALLVHTDCVRITREKQMFECFDVQGPNTNPKFYKYMQQITKSHFLLMTKQVYFNKYYIS